MIIFHTKDFRIIDLTGVGIGRITYIYILISLDRVRSFECNMVPSNFVVGNGLNNSTSSALKIGFDEDCHKRANFGLVGITDLIDGITNVF